MAGHPIQNKLIADITSAGGWEPILDRIADGETVAHIAKTFGVSRSFFSRVLHSDDARSKLASDARRKATETWADEALEIADNVPADRDEITKAKLRIDTRMGLAASFAPDVFGRKAEGGNVQINIGALHLAALRERAQVENALPTPPAALPVAEAEIIPEGHEEST